MNILTSLVQMHLSKYFGGKSKCSCVDMNPKKEFQSCCDIDMILQPCILLEHLKKVRLHLGKVKLDHVTCTLYNVHIFHKIMIHMDFPLKLEVIVKFKL